MRVWLKNFCIVKFYGTWLEKLDIRVALTSVLFALAHHPGTILAWCLYVSLGMFLGVVRYKSDLWGSMGLHLVWNLSVYVLFFL